MLFETELQEISFGAPQFDHGQDNAQNFTEIQIEGIRPDLNNFSTRKLDTGFILKNLIQVVEWFKKLVVHNDANITQPQLQALASKFEQLRDDCEKKLYLNIEGIIDPVMIRLKVQEAKHNLMCSICEELVSFYNENPILRKLYTSLAEYPFHSDDLAEADRQATSSASALATELNKDLIRGSFFSERLKQPSGGIWACFSGNGMDGVKESLRSWFPLLKWAPHYSVQKLRFDIVAAITVIAMLVPQAMAYALLAGMEPVYGLWTAIIPMALYCVLGGSRELSVGPSAMLSLTIPAAISHVVEERFNNSQADYNNVANSLAFLIGLMLLLSGLMRFGFIVENLLSGPVLNGFTQGAAVLIVVSQVTHLTGISVSGHPDTLQATLSGLAKNITQFNIWTFLLSAASTLLIIAMRKIHPKLPAALIVLIITTMCTWLSGADQYGVKVLRYIPSGFMKPRFPLESSKVMWELVGPAGMLSLLGYIEAIAVAKKFAAKGKYSIDGNQELLSLGAGNFFGSMFRAFPISASLARTAVNHQAGVATQLSSLFVAVLMTLVTLFFTRLFYYTPYAVLGAIVITAAYSLIEPKETLRLWRVDERGDLVMLLLTMLATIFLAPIVGVGVAIGLSLLEFIYRSSRPSFTEIGRISGTVVYKDVNIWPSAIIVPGVLCVKLEARLAFYNINWFQEKLQRLQSSAAHAVYHIVLDCGGISYIDSSAMRVLADEILPALQAKHVRLILCDVKDPVRDVMDRFAFTEKLGLANIFPTVHSAVEFIISEGDPTKKPSAAADRPSTALQDEDPAPATSQLPPAQELKLQKDAKKSKSYTPLDD